MNKAVIFGGLALLVAACSSESESSGSGGSAAAGAGGGGGGAAGGGGGDGGSTTAPGDAVWAVAVTRDGDNAVGQVEVDPNGDILLLGGERGPGVRQEGTFLAKIASDGTLLWRTRLWDLLSATSMWACPGGCATMVVDDSGNIVVFGKTFEANSPTADNDLVLAKLDPSGNIIWQRDFTNADDQSVAGVGMSAQGEIVIGGTFWHTVDFGGGELTAINSANYLARFDADGQHLFSTTTSWLGGADLTAVAGDRQYACHGQVHGLAMSAVDLQGVDVWAHESNAAEPAAAFAWDLAANPAGTVALVATADEPFAIGSDSVPLGAFAAEFGAAGAERILTLGGINSYGDAKVFAQSVAFGSSPSVLMVGGILLDSVTFPELTGFDRPNHFAARYDGANRTWVKGIPREIDFHSSVLALDVAADDSVVIAGTFDQPFTLDGTELVPVGAVDIYLAKLAP